MSHRRIFHAITVLLCTLILFGLNTAFLPTSRASEATQLPYVLYLPLVQHRAADSIFGLEVGSLTHGRDLGGIVNMGTSLIRRNGLLWRDIQPTEGGAYRWDAANVRALEEEMINASQNNLKLMVIVRGSPRWATEAATDCSAVKPAYFDDFARFMAAVVDRYSRPPYNVMYWELGNEIDVDPDLIGVDWAFGCWGDVDDEFYGGREYGEMLKVVSPAMKAVNPGVKILTGGLLLDRPYDPNYVDPADGKNHTRSARFIEGVFAVHAQNYFDILGYHFYVNYDEVSPDGQQKGVDWKAAYLRDIMRQYNVNKPLMNNEAALLCNREWRTEACSQAQADAVGRMYARAMADGIVGLVWYIYDGDGFRFTALVEPTNPAIKRPAYWAYKQAAAMLGGGTYLGPLTGQAAGVEGYRFNRLGRIVTIVWSNNPRAATIPVRPGAAVSCMDRIGTAMACGTANGTVSVTAGSGPIYVVE